MVEVNGRWYWIEIPEKQAASLPPIPDMYYWEKLVRLEQIEKGCTITMQGKMLRCNSICSSPPSTQIALMTEETDSPYMERRAIYFEKGVALIDALVTGEAYILRRKNPYQ